MSHSQPTAVLAGAAATAGYAPSVHNTQPWRWRVGATVLDLFADHSRQLAVEDPVGRLMIMSCGAALHHARIALAAEGCKAVVERLPDPDDPDHLARITLGEQGMVDPDAERVLRAVQLRHTDRRPVSAIPVGPAELNAVRAAGTAEGIDMHRLTADQVIELGSASAHADAIGTADPGQLHELSYWIGGDRPGGLGVPDSVLLDRPSESIVPGRDFVRLGSVSSPGGHDREAVYVVLFGPGDDAADWLRAGEAMSASWLSATELGLSVLPFSAVVEVTATRETLRRLLSFVGYPYLVLRLGVPEPQPSAASRTPRLPADQIIEFV